MSRFATVKFVCKYCKGTKLVGEQYYALGENWVDITCVRCSHSKDITVEDLELLMRRINKANAVSKIREVRDANNKTNSE
jgi:hypothetical protein